MDDDDDLNSEWNRYEPDDTSNQSPMFLTKRVRNIGICIVLISVLAVLIPRATKHKSIVVSDVAEVPRIKGTPQYTCPTSSTLLEDYNHISSTNNDTAASLSEIDKDDSDTTTLITTVSSLSTTSSDGTLTNTNTDLTSTFTYYDDRIIQECEEFISNRSDNFDSFAATFRNSSYIPCGNSYTMFGNVSYVDVKNSIRDWKVLYFLSNLKTGDSIYHSGAGIGLNLLLTLEILHEANSEHYVTDLHVYGNDHIPMIAQLANLILDSLTAQAGSAKRGVICGADSTSLHTFVPRDSFDLVYASSIPALPDPLELNLFWTNNTWDENQHHMDQLCSLINNNNDSNNKKDVDWKAMTLIELAQQRQNNWYALWVSEMIQIAKADTPVIIEYVGQPYCSQLDTTTTNTNAKNKNSNNDNKRLPSTFNNIGVPKSFWNEAIVQYKWNINPDTLHIVDDILFPSTYHVFMKTKTSGT
jgi:hypothetical protein